MRLLKSIGILLVTIILFSYCTFIHPTGANAAETIKTSAKEYVVIAGDTLSLIAERYGTTWQKLWELNKNEIVDPDLIYIGQKIRITGKPTIPIPVLTREEKIDKLVKFMFKTSKLKFDNKKDLERDMRMLQHSIYMSGIKDFANQRQSMVFLTEKTRQYEIWVLAESIVDLSPDEEAFYKIVGLCWQESHFINRKGGHAEVSFFQFLPATIKNRFQLDDIGLITALWELENNPRVATAAAIEMLMEYRWNWIYYNSHSNYPGLINNKITRFKQEWNRRK